MSIPQPCGFLNRRLTSPSSAEPVQYFENSALRFWYAAPCTPDFLNSLASQLDRLAAAGAEPVKQNPLRQVWRMPVSADARLPLSAVFLKICRPIKRQESFKQRLLGTSAGREWHHLLYARDHDIPAIRPLALIEEKQAPHRGRNILITQAVERVLSLDECWTAIQQDRAARQDLLLSVADTLARAHQAGLCPVDLHPGNLLAELPTATAGAGQKPVSHLLDLYKARTGRPVSDRQVVQTFTELNHWFRTQSSRPERVRFARLYLRQRDLYGRLTPYSRNLGLDMHDLICAIARQEPLHAERLARGRDRRIFGDGRYFARLKFDDDRRAVVWLMSKHPGPDPLSHLKLTPAEWRAALATRTDLWTPNSDFAQVQLGNHTLKLERCWPLPAPLKGRGRWRHRQRWLKGRFLHGQVAAWAALWHDLNRARSARWPLLLLESPQHPAVVWLAAEI